MATVYANVGVNFHALNLNERFDGEASFADNVDFTSTLGRTYEDSYRIDFDASPPQRSYFLGTGITVDSDLAVTGGTAQGYQQDVWNGSAWVSEWGIEGFSSPAVDLYNAASTPTPSDDKDVMWWALRGNDTFRLSGQADLVTGYDGNDTIRGMGGNDTLYGDYGNDMLIGGAGNDQLDGEHDADTMAGGSGNDTYIVKQIGDVVVETSTLATEIDTIYTTVTHTIEANVENLFIEGGGTTSATGNALANRIVGNDAANALWGMGGDDSLAGNGRSDALFGDAGDDTLNGGDGGDRLDSGAGSDAVNGGDGNDLLLGDVGNDSLRGGTGDDLLIGSSGNDVLSGGSGADVFRFNSRLNSSNHVDRITDFSGADDLMMLSDVAFAAVGAPGTLSEEAFRLGTAAADATDRIVYDSSTGSLWYDADGAGGAAAILFATVTPGSVITFDDFLVY